MSNTVLDIKNLTINFTKTVVAIDSLTLTKGETLAIVGESGSGKSLTALAVMQLLPKSCKVSKKAKICYAGKDLLNISEKEMRYIRGRRIGLIFQEALSALNPVLTIGQQILEVLTTHKIATKNPKQHIIELLKEVNLPNPEKCYASYPHQLSGGMNQRAIIALAIASKPQVLIADEPTTALDVTVQTKIMELLNSLKTKHNMSVIFITHNLSLVQDFADKVAVMHTGKIIEYQNTKKFFKSPESEYSKALLDAIIIKKQQTNTQEYEDNILQVSKLGINHYNNNSWFRKTISFSVTDINFSLSSGETLAIIGESGSGKTTIAKALLQLNEPNTGTIKLFGKKLNFGTRASTRLTQDSIQMIFQNPDTSMNPRFTIAEVMTEGLRAKKSFYSEKQIQQAIDSLLLQVGLEPNMKSRYPHEFSGGQKQRICIARALSLQPKIIICDEPTSALDVSIQAQIISLLKSLQKQHSYAYILITHDFSLVSSFADKVIVMKDGEIVEAGPVKNILLKPQQEYTKILLRSIPSMQSSAIATHHMQEQELSYEST